MGFPVFRCLITGLFILEGPAIGLSRATVPFYPLPSILPSSWPSEIERPALSVWYFSPAWGLGRTLSATAPSRSRKAFDHARPLTKEWAPEDLLVPAEGACEHASTGITGS